MTNTITSIAANIEAKGYAYVPASIMKTFLDGEALSSWDTFSATWDDMPQDLYMADGGRYRRRRHAVFQMTEETLVRLPHAPHYQSLDHNILNGGIERWFEPVKDETTANPVHTALLCLCRHVFGDADPVKPFNHKVEMHQFRIEPSATGAGKPTPEGVHRDGVDWVCVLLVDRVNVGEGVTGIYAPDGKSLGEFTLAKPLDCVFLNDHRVMHGVTPIKLVDPGQPGFRDVLVLTFKRI